MAILFQYQIRKVKIVQMTLEDRIELLSELGDRIVAFDDPKIELAITKAHHENQWFVPENSKKSLNAISEQFLNKEKLTEWTNEYDLTKVNPKSIGLVLAGNIPLVGFHDLLCTIISGHNAVIKTSSKDDSLVQMILDIINDIKKDAKEKIKVVDQLSDYDAVIATGSNNTAQHFEYYFRNYPNIIRKNRVSVAVLSGDESKDDLEKLGNDVFDYFGLGCRNISKIFIPSGYDLNQLFEAFYPFKEIINHNKYNNNYAYNEAIWMMGQDDFVTNGFIILKKENSLYSRIASLYYQSYDDLEEVEQVLSVEKDNIQCISSNMTLKEAETIALGICQSPSLSDYADHIDTLDFLINL